jgi:hypothetical protein
VARAFENLATLVRIRTRRLDRDTLRHRHSP